MKKNTTWEVYFEGSFRSHPGRKRKGQEVPVNRWFDWEGVPLLLPAYYLCSDGIAVDLCVRAEAAALRSYIEKWNLLEDGHQDEDTLQWELIRQENPLELKFHPSAVLNGKPLKWERRISISWIPESCMAGTSRQEGAEMVAHYGLNPEAGWCCHRLFFRWYTRRKPLIRSLGLHLESGKQLIPGEKFVISSGDAKNREISFRHPGTGVLHKLSVRSLLDQELDLSERPRKEFAYPGYFKVLAYTLEPDLAYTEISLRDCAAPDPARKLLQEEMCPEGASSEEKVIASAVSIIGGADGPTAIFVSAGKAGEHVHSVCSSLHFAPVEQVEWQMVFSRKARADLELEIL